MSKDSALGMPLAGFISLFGLGGKKSVESVTKDIGMVAARANG